MLMAHDPNFILNVLDGCTRKFAFPALDNGFWYLAASRLSLHYSPDDWALVIEIFGYNPRAGIPDTSVHTFASRLHNRHPPDSYSQEQRETYLAQNPNNECAFFHPVADGPWMDDEAAEMVSPTGFVELRSNRVPLPSLDQYAEAGIDLSEDRPAIYELCRYLASRHRDAVMATSIERRVNVPPQLVELLVLEDWHHPNLIAKELPSQTETFRQLVQVLSTGDRSLYRPTESPNTHWSNWPDGGSL
jgi:hypothetical protein